MQMTDFDLESETAQPAKVAREKGEWERGFDQRMLQMDLEFAKGNRFGAVAGLGVSSVLTAGIPVLTWFSAQSFMQHRADAQQAVGDWKAAASPSIASAKITFAKHTLLADTVEQCADKTIAAFEPQPYVLQKDGSLAVASPVVPAAKLNTQFQTCVQQDVQNIANREGGVSDFIIPVVATAAFATMAWKSLGRVRESVAKVRDLNARLNAPATP